MHTVGYGMPRVPGLLCNILQWKIGPLFEEVLKLHSLASKNILHERLKFSFVGTSHFEKSHAKAMYANGHPNAKKSQVTEVPSFTMPGGDFQPANCYRCAVTSSDRLWFRAFHLQSLESIDESYIISVNHVTPGVFPRHFKGKHWRMRIQIRCSRDRCMMDLKLHWLPFTATPMVYWPSPCYPRWGEFDS